VIRARLRQRNRGRTRVRSLSGDEICTAPLTDHDREEQAERIARALDALPERYERVLRGKYLEQRSVAELAAEAGESAKAVESLLTRARQAFRDIYHTGIEP
jgi:RNA polymerase sigma factor (sigma-70 family)